MLIPIRICLSGGLSRVQAWMFACAYPWGYPGVIRRPESMLIPELIRASFCLHDFERSSMFQGATQRLLSVLLGGPSAVLLYKATPQAWTQVQVLVILAYPCAYPLVILGGGPD